MLSIKAFFYLIISIVVSAIVGGIVGGFIGAFVYEASMPITPTETTSIVLGWAIGAYAFFHVCRSFYRYLRDSVFGFKLPKV